MTSKNTIAIVDDDPDDRDLIKDAFLESNPERDLILLENGDRLIDFLQTTADEAFPSLILLDLNMPGKDGRDALQEIKKSPVSSYSYHCIQYIFFGNRPHEILWTGGKLFSYKT